MKVLQPRLLIGTEGKVLIDSTNIKSNSVNKNSKKRKNDVENLQPSKVKRIDCIYADPPAAEKKFANAATQTESYEITDVKKCNRDQSIIDMLTNDETPSEYWEALAEKRRFALEVALDENRTLNEEIEVLKGENKVLEEMLEEAKQLATLVQEITNAEETSKNLLSIEESAEKEKTNGVVSSSNKDLHDDDD